MRRHLVAGLAVATIVAIACAGAAEDGTGTPAAATPATTSAQAAAAAPKSPAPAAATDPAPAAPTTSTVAPAPPTTTTAGPAPTTTAADTAPPAADTPTPADDATPPAADDSAPAIDTTTPADDAPDEPATTTPADDAPDASTTDAPDEPAEEAAPAKVPGTEPPGAGLGDSLYPLLGNAGYDVLHYGIELDVDPAANTISALTTITALATEDLPAFNLDLSGLDVHSVTVDGLAAGFSRSDTELTVVPELAVAQGTEFTVDVDYSGSPEPITDPAIPFARLGWNWQDGVVYTSSQPTGAMTWFPSNNHPSDKATYELRITVPQSTTAAATGLLIDETTADGATTTTWRMDDPMATYLAAVYIGDFERLERGRLNPDGPLLRDYVPRDSPPGVGEALAVAHDALRFFEELLGPYPFDAYGTLVLPFLLDVALENQTLPVHGPQLLNPGIIAHEAAHQWLGNAVSLEDWGDVWLNEGFATYLHMMFEADHAGYDFDRYMWQLYLELPFLAAEPPGAVHIDELFGPSVYVRGAMTLHALRLHAGDETFFEILRAHYERSAGGTTSTGEFLRIVAEFAGPEAVDLVESWLYDDTVPDLPQRRPE